MKIGLVLEGGGMRGLFSAAVLDVLLEQRINIDTITPDISTYYKWYGEIENMQLKQ